MAGYTVKPGLFLLLCLASSLMEAHAQDGNSSGVKVDVADLLYGSTKDIVSGATEGILLTEDSSIEGEIPENKTTQVELPLPLLGFDINETIQEVEEILGGNPELPRLSREEIIDILDNITHSLYLNLTGEPSPSDINAAGSVKDQLLYVTPSTLQDPDTSTGFAENAVSSNRSEEDRALMVVMPFNTNNLTEAKIKELYTRIPITRIITTTIPTTVSSTYATSTEKTSTQSLKPTDASTITFSSDTPKFPAQLEGLPKDLKDTLVSFGLFNIDQSALAPTSALNQTTSAVTTTPTTTKPNIPKNVKEVLATIGLFPDSDKNLENGTKAKDSQSNAASISPEMKEFLASFGLIPPNNESQNSSKESNNPVASFTPSVAKPTIDPESFKNFKPLPASPQQSPAQSGHDKGNDLSPDMRQFLASFGLVSDGETASQSSESDRSHKSLLLENNSTEKVLPAVETNFKKNGSFSTKPFLPYFPSFSSEQALPDDVSAILKSLGFSSKENNTLPSESSIIDLLGLNINASESGRKLITEGNVFRPVDIAQIPLNETENFEKLQKLLGTFKLLLNESVTDSDIESILGPSALFANFTSLEDKNILGNLNFEGNKTDENNNSITFDQLLDIFNDSISKNEVKREEPTTEASLTTTAASTTTEKEEEKIDSPSLDDLASSFGGDEPEPSFFDFRDTPPEPKPNGFYFYLDWNSFLNVGYEDENPVDIRFAPKLGNKNYFIPVKVP